MSDLLHELDRVEFETRFPEIYISDWTQVSVCLDDGTVLLESEWNGEKYISDGYDYIPEYQQTDDDEYDIVGYRKCL